MARTKAPKTTRLSNDVTKPQPTDPGDAPADTYDPKERASSARPDKAAAAADGHQTVNAVVKSGEVPDNTPTGTRSETYERVGPDGTTVYVTHNYDTGETAVSDTPPAG
ncbi:MULTISPECIES: hypothetical protein [unclassified Pseudactinotalea]|uniref:hypothetical protein n=1 Tax=Micrococcales TaxID=85006 RepID=UPI003C7C9DE7